MITNSNHPQQTIISEINFEGKGLHTGVNCKLRLLPAPEDFGIVFILKTKDKNIEIPANIDYVISTNRGTNLHKDGYSIHTVEHLLSSLYALDITNLKIEISSNELPILDGSSKIFFDKIIQSGIKVQNKNTKEFVIDKYISFKSSKGVSFNLIPDNSYKFTYHLSYQNMKILNQKYTINIDKNTYRSEICSSKTFCLLSELLFLHKHDLVKGGTLDNAIVYIDQEVNKEEMNQINNLFKNKKQINYSNIILNDVNFKDENHAVKHKILDLIGDISLLGFKIKGHIIAHKSGHESNIELLNFIKKQYIDTQNIKLKGNNMYDIKEILSIMPHRYPFLLVDKILHLESGKTVSAIKNVTINEPFFLGHFPDKPVMPGVLLLEAMAQAGGFLVLHSIDNPKEKLIYLSSIKSAKFKTTVQPGDQLLIKAELNKFKLGTCKIISKIFVYNNLITECELLASVVNRYD